MVLTKPVHKMEIENLDIDVEGMEQSAIQDAGLSKKREKHAMHRYLPGQHCFQTSSEMVHGWRYTMSRVPTMPQRACSVKSTYAE